MYPRTLRRQIDSLLHELFFASTNGDRGLRHRVVRIKTDDEFVSRAMETRYSAEVCARDPTDLAYRHPVFGKTDHLPRFEESVRLLIPEEPCLDFEVSTFIVGERFAPIEAIGIHAPGPNLLCGQIFVSREMNGAGV